MRTLLPLLLILAVLASPRMTSAESGEVQFTNFEQKIDLIDPPSNLPESIEPADFCVENFHQASPRPNCPDCSNGCLRSLWTDNSVLRSTVFDLLILEPSYLSGSFSLQDDTDSVGWRLNSSIENSAGFGLGSRCTVIETSSEGMFDSGGSLDEFGFKVVRGELDLYRRFWFERSSLVVGGNIAWASLQLKIDDAYGPWDRGIGAGPRIALRHQLYGSHQSELSLVSEFRTAYLMGEWEDVDRVGMIEGDSVIEIEEALLGLEYLHRFLCGYFVGGCSFESQSWETSYLGRVNFLGTVVRLGFYY